MATIETPHQNAPLNNDLLELSQFSDLLCTIPDSHDPKHQLRAEIQTPLQQTQLDCDNATTPQTDTSDNNELTTTT